MTVLEDAARRRIAAMLPDLLGKALESYELFATHDVPELEAKSFSAHHTACKVAIAHIELLVRLARQVDLEDEARAAEARRVALEAGTLAEIAAAAAEAGEEAGKED